MSKIHAKILKKVRADRYSNIRNGGGICNELPEVTKNSDDTYLYAKNQIVEWISESLYPTYYYCHWVGENSSREVYRELLKSNFSKGRYA